MSRPYDLQADLEDTGPYGVLAVLLFLVALIALLLRPDEEA